MSCLCNDERSRSLRQPGAAFFFFFFTVVSLLRHQVGHAPTLIKERGFYFFPPVSSCHLCDYPCHSRLYYFRRVIGLLLRCTLRGWFSALPEPLVSLVSASPLRLPGSAASLGLFLLLSGMTCCLPQALGLERVSLRA